MTPPAAPPSHPADKNSGVTNVIFMISGSKHIQLKLFKM